MNFCLNFTTKYTDADFFDDHFAYLSLMCIKSASKYNKSRNFLIWSANVLKVPLGEGAFLLAPHCILVLKKPAPIQTLIHTIIFFNKNFLTENYFGTGVPDPILGNYQYSSIS